MYYILFDIRLVNMILYYYYYTNLTSIINTNLQRITAVLRVETYIITIIIVSPVRQVSNLQLFYSQVVRLVIMYVEIYRTNVIVYIM